MAELTKRHGDMTRHKKNNGINRNTRFPGIGRTDSVSVYVFFIFCIFPLLLGPGGYQSITKTRFVLFATATVIFLFDLLIFGTGKGRKEPVPAGNRSVFLCLAAYCGWAVISALFSVYGWRDVFLGQSRYEGLFSILLYAAAFSLASRCTRLPSFFSFALSVMAAVMAVLAIAQEFGATFLYPEGYTYRGVQFLTTVGQHDCLSGICSILLPMMAAGFVLRKDENENPLKQGFRVLTIMLLTYAMLESGVDSGRLSVLGGVLAVLPFLIDCREHLGRFLLVLSGLFFSVFLKNLITVSASYEITLTFHAFAILFFLLSPVLLGIGLWLHRHPKEFSIAPKRLRKISWLILLALGLLAVGSLFFYRGSDPLLYEASELLHGRLDDRAGQFRGYIWKGTLDIIKQNPVFGTGPGTFAAAFEPYAAGYMEYLPNTGVDMAHNDYLQIAACLGIPGLLLYLGFLGSLLIRAGRSIQKRYEASGTDSSACGCIPILAAGIIGYLVFSCFGFSIAIYTPLFWVAAGLLASVERRE